MKNRLPAAIIGSSNYNQTRRNISPGRLQCRSHKHTIFHQNCRRNFFAAALPEFTLSEASLSTSDNIRSHNSLPDTISTHFFSGSDAIDTGRLVFLVDDFHPSSAFNSAHVASLSESGVSLATENYQNFNFWGGGGGGEWAMALVIDRKSNTLRTHSQFVCGIGPKLTRNHIILKIEVLEAATI